MTETINTHEAKSRLSEIIRKVENGVDVVVARNGVPVVRIIPWVPEADKTPGSWAGLVSYDDDIVGSDPEVVATFDESARSDL